MVQLPNNFTAIRFAGYFLNTDNMRLYSIKQSGVLTKIKHYVANPWRKSGYTISIKGKPRSVTDEYLQALKEKRLYSPETVYIPVTEKVRYKQEEKQKEKYYG